MLMNVSQVCTKILEKNANPQWNQSLTIPIRVRITVCSTNKNLLLLLFKKKKTASLLFFPVSLYVREDENQNCRLVNPNIYNKCFS